MTIRRIEGGLIWPGPFLNNPRIVFSGTNGGLGLGSMGPIGGVGQKMAMMGHIVWEGGGAVTKTVSTNSYIHFSLSTVTFADAATTVRLGIQDVATSAADMQPDGVFDVYTDLVGNDGRITSADDYVNKSIQMTAGSKSIANGDLIAVVFDMTARGGTDTIAISLFLADGYAIWPATRTYTTSWQTLVNGVMPCVMIQADDGTFGIMRGTAYIAQGAGGSSFSGIRSYNSGSTPDEYGLLFSVPFRCQIDGAVVCMGANGATCDANLNIYSSPETTPVLLASVSIPGDQSVTVTDDRPRFVPLPEMILEANTQYCLALEATGAGSIELGYVPVVSTTHRGVNGWGTCSQTSRTNGSGAFSSSPTAIPLLGINICGLDDGSGVGAANFNLGGLS